MNGESKYHFKYRADIDGLRAIAVLLVVFFHANLGCPGGFVGVDIFFVISGYLITSIIVKEIEAGKFELKRFWVRRFKRILPAAYFMTTVVGLVGIFLLLPQDLVRLSKTCIAHLVFLANFYFAMGTDYFAGNAERLPLLHTWSLAVEEQFYFIFPFVVFVLGRRWNLQILFAALVAIVSLGLNIGLVEYYTNETFYLLPSRAWELMAGSLLSLLRPRSLGKIVDEIGAMVGILLIGLSVCWFDHETVFPGINALLPVSGAVLLIYCNTNTSTKVAQILSTGPCVFVGLISYSVYLWHWPVLAYLRYLQFEITVPVGITVLISSLALGYASWKFIEQPFRKNERFNSLGSVGGIALVTAIVLCIGFSQIYFSRGLPGRLEQNISESVNWLGMEYDSGTLPLEKSVKSIGVEEQDKLQFAIWGDSHGRVLGKGFDLAARNLGATGCVLTRSGTPPLLNSWRGDLKRDKLDTEGINFKSACVEFLADHDIKRVILVGRWSLYVEGYNAGEVEAGLVRKATTQNQLLVDAQSSEEKSVDEAAAAFRRSLELTRQELESKGIEVWIVRQIPEQSSPVGINTAKQSLSKIPYKIKTSCLELHRERQRRVDEIIDQLFPAERIIDVSRNLFDEEGNLLAFDSDATPTYRDTDHLTQAGIGLIFPDLQSAMALFLRQESN